MEDVLGSPGDSYYCDSLHKLKSRILGDTRDDGALMCTYPSHRQAQSCLRSLSMASVVGQQLQLPTWWGLFETITGESVLLISCDLSREEQYELADKSIKHGGVVRMLSNDAVLSIRDERTPSTLKSVRLL